MKIGTQSFQVIHPRLIGAVFQIGYLSLGHMDRRTQFRLIQLPLFPQKPQLFTKSQIHSITENSLPFCQYFCCILDAKRLKLVKKRRMVPYFTRRYQCPVSCAGSKQQTIRRSGKSCPHSYRYYGGNVEEICRMTTVYRRDGKPVPYGLKAMFSWVIMRTTLDLHMQWKNTTPFDRPHDCRCLIGGVMTPPYEENFSLLTSHSSLLTFFVAPFPVLW